MKAIILGIGLFFISTLSYAIDAQQCNKLIGIRHLEALKANRECVKLSKALAADYPAYLFKNPERMIKRIQSDIQECASLGLIENSIDKIDVYHSNFAHIIPCATSNFSQDELQNMYKGSLSQRDMLVLISPKIVNQTLNQDELQFILELVGNIDKIQDEELANEVETIDTMIKAINTSNEVIAKQKELLNTPLQELKIGEVKNHIANIEKAQQALDRTNNTIYNIDKYYYKEMQEDFHKFRMRMNRAISEYPNEIEEYIQKF